jgi:hypothetical protein
MATTYKITGIKRVNLGIVKTYDIAGTAPTNVATTWTAGSGEGADFALASSTNKIRAFFPAGPEMVWVTARSVDTLTIDRGKEGTVATAQTTGTDTVKVIKKVRFTFANAFNIDPQNQEITSQGDNLQEYVTLNLGMRGSMAADKFDTEVLEKIIGATAITALLPPDEATRYYPEGGNYPNVGAEVDLIAIDDSTGLTQYIRIAVPKMQLYPRPWVPGNAATAAKMPTTLNWTALQTTTDLMGHTLPSIPTDGVFYWIAVLA